MMYWKTFLCMAEGLPRDPFERDWVEVFGHTQDLRYWSVG